MKQPLPLANILVVDDTAENLRLLAGMLADQGHVARPFPRGDLALRAAAADPPDLVLLDINMPQMNGYEVCDRLKSDPATADIPVIFISALTDTEDKIRAFDAGGVDFITKPFRFEEVRARVDTHLRLRRLQLESDERFRAVFEHAAIGLAIVTATGTLKNVNQQFCEMLGYPADELTTMSVGDITYPGDLDVDAPEIRKLFGGQVDSVSASKRYVRKDGSTLWGSLSLGPVHEPDGSVRHAIAAVEDVTERVEAERALRRSERSFRTLLDAAPDAMIIVDDRGVITQVNDTTERLFGFGVGEILGQPVEILIPTRFPGHAGKRQAFFGHATSRPMGLDLDLFALRKDGSEFPAEISLSPLKTDEGDRVLAVVRDITERKAAALQLREQQVRLQLALDASQVGIWSWNLQTDVLTWDDQMCRIFGLPPDAVRNYDTFASCLHADDAGRVGREIQQAIEKATDFDTDYRVVWADYTVRDVLAKGRVLFDGDGRPLRMNGVCVDVSERKRVQAQLRSSEARLKEAQAIAHTGHWELDLGTDRLLWSDEVFRIFGHDPSDFEPALDAFVQSVHPDEREGVLSAFNAHLERGDDYDIVHRVIRPDGQARFVRERCLTERDSAGEPQRSIGTVQDITEQRQVEQELRQHREHLEELVAARTTELEAANEEIRGSEERYRRLFESNPDAILIADTATMRFRYANSAACAMLAYDPDQLAAMSVPDIHPQESLPRVLEAFEAMIAGRETVAADIPCLRSDGQIRFADIGGALLDIGGEKQMVGMFRDITERKRAVEALADSEQWLRTVVEASQEGIITVDERGVITIFNAAAERIFGWPRDEVVGGPIEVLIRAHRREMHTEEVRRYFTSGVNDDLMGGAHELTGLARDGREFPLELSLSEGAFGDRRFVLAVVRDITERKRAEAELRKLSRAVEQSPTSVVVTDPSGTIEYVNPKFCEVTGYSAEEAVGQNPRVLNSGHQSAEHYTSMWETLAAGQEWRGEFCNRRKDGEIFWEYASISPIRDEDGDATHYVAVKEDITERKQMEDDLRRAREAAETASRAKSAFLAGMSHELRTPLNAIIGFAEVLADETFGEMNDKQVRYVDHIETSGKHLLALINDILDLSKVEAGKMELELGPVAVDELLDRGVTMIREKATKHGIAVTVDVVSDLVGTPIEADERKLMQVVFNLLSNAAKFTPDGGSIEVRAWRTDAEVRVSVEDTGIGLDPADHERVFGEFEQADATLARQHQGTGLGLALSRRLMEMHGGKLWVESAGEGCGSTFTLALPASGVPVIVEED